MESEPLNDNRIQTTKPWMVSLHGGHSGDYCDHASGTLRELLDAAIVAGYHTFGVSEHAPRCAERFLYPNELSLGWSYEKILADFERYIADIDLIAKEYQGRLNVLRGFEAEVVPTATYVQAMTDYRGRKLKSGEQVFDYFVGSVHYVREHQIDGEPENWVNGAKAFGGVEQLAIAYYDEVTEMVKALKPDVVGHLDLIKRNVILACANPDELQTEAVQHAVDRTLAVIKANGAILDLNTAGWRKGLGEPYPAPWLIAKANAVSVPFCFGDDSHQPAQVGEGIEAARLYLLENGVTSITTIGKDGTRPVHSLVE